MSNDNALFEDDFDMDFEDDFDSALTSVIEDNSGLQSVDLDAPQKDLSDFDPDDIAGDDDPITISEFEDGGHRAIPAISAMAFCESSRTVSLMEAVASDRRMADVAPNFFPAKWLRWCSR